MKIVIFTLSVILYAAFISCSKNDITEDSIVKGFASTEPAASVTVITGWEAGWPWNQSDSSDYKVFSVDRAVPSLNQDILRNGAVLVFIKNFMLEDDRRVNKPVRIPFHVLPSFGKPGYDQAWYHINTPGHIILKYRTNKHKFGIEAEIPDQQVESRFFIISPSDLRKYNHSPASISRLTYQQLIDLLDVGQ